MYFVECLCVAWLVTLPLLESLLLDLLLDGDIVIFEASQGRLQLNRPLLGVLDCRRDQSITGSHHGGRHHHLILIWNCSGGGCHQVTAGWWDSALSFFFERVGTLCCRGSAASDSLLLIVILGGALQHFALLLRVACRHRSHLCLLELFVVGLPHCGFLFHYFSNFAIISWI